MEHDRPRWRFRLSTLMPLVIILAIALPLIIERWRRAYSPDGRLVASEIAAGTVSPLRVNHSCRGSSVEAGHRVRRRTGAKDAQRLPRRPRGDRPNVMRRDRSHGHEPAGLPSFPEAADRDWVPARSIATALTPCAIGWVTVDGPRVRVVPMRT
jgi:hypothetical protein